MKTRNTVRTPTRLLVLFVLLSAIPLVALAWLGWRLLDQDRALETQRLRERLDNSSSLAVRELERGLTAWEGLLSSAAQDNSAALPAGAALIFFDSRGVVAHQGAPLPYYPIVSAQREPSADAFVTAEAVEFRDENLAKAAASYRVLASSREPGIRAGGLMRLARCLRKQGSLKESLAVYSELEAMGELPVAGLPAELLARGERIALFRLLGDREATARETTSLAEALLAGRFLIDRATFEFYAETAALSERPLTPDLQLANAVEALWPMWQQQASGRIAWTAGSPALVAAWRRIPAGTVAVVGSVDTLMKSTDAVTQSLQVRLSLEDQSGHAAWGSLPKDEIQVTRTFRETGLPWTLRVAPSDPKALRAALASRRNLLVAGLGLMVLVIAVASYFVFRAVGRDLRVAQLQSDFVAAVSHEFRTPLTAMRHLTDMLEEGSVSADRLPRYYGALGKETRRLHEMVESLLDFGSMESGRRTFHMEVTSAAELTQRVVDEFRERDTFAAQRIELQAGLERDNRHTRIRADSEALALALRNLLDNAIKYSPESSTVSISVEAHEGFAGISVQDQGAGIPKEEQRDVFRKFVRGTSARTFDVKGTGIGLTLADQIVKAHGGRLELASVPGQGSRFTIFLPVLGNHP